MVRKLDHIQEIIHHLNCNKENSRRIDLMLNGVHESKIYFTVQLGVNKLASGGVKTSIMRQDVLWNRIFTPRCETSIIAGSLYERVSR